MEWLNEKLGRRRPELRADRALSEASDVIHSARSLRQQLEPFRRETDPFAAITRWHKVSEEINSSESAGALRGPFH